MFVCLHVALSAYHVNVNVTSAGDQPQPETTDDIIKMPPALAAIQSWLYANYNSSESIEIEHGFTSAPTQYRLYGRRFLQV